MGDTHTPNRISGNLNAGPMCSGDMDCMPFVGGMDGMPLVGDIPGIPFVGDAPLGP